MMTQKKKVGRRPVKRNPVLAYVKKNYSDSYKRYLRLHTENPQVYSKYYLKRFFEIDRSQIRKIEDVFSGLNVDMLELLEYKDILDEKYRKEPSFHIAIRGEGIRKYTELGRIKRRSLKHCWKLVLQYACLDVSTLNAVSLEVLSTFLMAYSPHSFWSAPKTSRLGDALSGSKTDETDLPDEFLLPHEEDQGKFLSSQKLIRECLGNIIEKNLTWNKIDSYLSNAKPKLQLNFDQGVAIELGHAATVPILCIGSLIKKTFDVEDKSNLDFGLKKCEYCDHGYYIKSKPSKSPCCHKKSCQNLNLQ